MTKETPRTAVTQPYKRIPAETAAMNRFNERAAGVQLRASRLLWAKEVS
jgi:hypothetical protein